MRARTVKHLIAAAIALGLSVPLTPAVLSFVWLVFPKAPAGRVAIVPNRGWELGHPVGPRLLFAQADLGDVDSLLEYASRDEPFDLASNQWSPLDSSRQALYDPGSRFKIVTASAALVLTTMDFDGDPRANGSDVFGHWHPRRQPHRTHV